MGVSLERVQSKFACIIGELCNEPVVLSKFAIWLDLRLAEYKAKGAISLDCSGENPDPVWLKGHEKPPPIVYSTGDPSQHRSGNDSAQELFNYDSNTHTQGIFHYSSSTSQTQGSPRANFGLNSDIKKDINERLSPEIVVVKEEVPDQTNSDNIYPVGFHVHGNKNRKRPSADIFVSSTPKNPRHMNDSCLNSAKTETQSLMSIIGETTDNVDQSLSMQSTRDSSMTFSPHTSAADQSYTQATVSSAENSQEYSSYQPQLDQSLSRTQSLQNTGNTNQMVEEISNPRDTEEGNLVGLRSFYTKSVLARIRDKNIKSEFHISSAVGQLECWLNLNYKENRGLENIPPKPLDEYLCNYFETVRRPSGKDFQRVTFTSLRSYIERFLREQGYPCSIIRNAVFQKSQFAFEQRRKLLSH